MKKIKVLIIDDSQLIHEVLTSIISADPRLEVVGCAIDPHEARQMIKDLNPDVLTLDVEMPRMNGLTFLKNLMRLRPMPVVMVSTLTSEGSNITLQALELGAIDFIEKPTNINESIEDFRKDIISQIITAAGVSKAKLHAVQSRLKNGENSEQATQLQKINTAETAQQPSSRVIAIGGSTGGLEAVRNMLGQTRFTGAETIVIALHLPGGFTQSYAERLNNHLPLTVKQGEHGERLMPGHIYIAPGGRHMEIKRRAAGFQIVLSDSQPVNRHRPSVDVLFDSVAKQAKNSSMGILLTGMGKDGAQGLKNMFEAGATTYAQDEESSVVWGMPGAAVKIGAVPQTNVKSLHKLASFIPIFAKRQ